MRANGSSLTPPPLKQGSADKLRKRPLEIMFSSYSARCRYQGVTGLRGFRGLWGLWGFGLPPKP